MHLSGTKMDTESEVGTQDYRQESLALASMARDDSPASSMTSSTAAAVRGKVGSEFET